MGIISVFLLEGSSMMLFELAKQVVERLLRMEIKVVFSEDEAHLIVDKGLLAPEKYRPDKKYFVEVENGVEVDSIPSNVFLASNGWFVPAFASCIDTLAKELISQYLPLFRSKNEELSRILLVSDSPTILGSAKLQLGSVYPMEADAKISKAMARLSSMAKDEPPFDILLVAYSPRVEASKEEGFMFLSELLDLFLEFKKRNRELMILVVDTSFDQALLDTHNGLMEDAMGREECVSAVSIVLPISKNPIEWSEVLGQVCYPQYH